MYRSEQDTIFAVASGSGRAAVTIVRLSGPDTGRLLDVLAGSRPRPRRATLRRLRDADGETLDRALVLWFPGPASYTGEDMAELQLHGGRAVLAAVAEALTQQGAFPAEPGEFSRRAYLNGRMDLIEAEAIQDLVDAETSAQRKQALRQLDGALGEIYRGWTQRLVRLLAQQEALIDFPDEDLPPAVEAAVGAEIDSLSVAIAEHLNDGRRGERLRDGLVFAITGAPNVGKSTLMNALVGREVAIVSPVEGTTRDVLEARVALGEIPVILLDTAGLRTSGDAIEAEGVRRALLRANEADMVIRVVASAASNASTGMADEAMPRDVPVIVVANKSDLYSWRAPGVVHVSGLTGMGLDRLRDALTEHARRMTEAAGPPPITRSRHRAALLEAAARLGSAREATLPEMRAEDLRLAVRAIGSVTGVIGVEAILDSVFSQFCIGK